MVYTASIIGGENQKKQEEITEKSEAECLISLYKARKRKRMLFFNSSDGVGLRVAVRSHAPIQEKKFLFSKSRAKRCGYVRLGFSASESRGGVSRKVYGD